jgi:hypothetical protein
MPSYGRNVGKPLTSGNAKGLVLRPVRIKFSSTDSVADKRGGRGPTAPFSGGEALTCGNAARLGERRRAPPHRGRVSARR